MTAPAATRPHGDALLATLAGASITACLGQAGKEADGTPRIPPYVVVHLAPGAVRSEDGSDRGTLADPNKDVDLFFQTTSVAVSAEAALQVHDNAVAALLGAAPAVAGRTTVKPVVLAETPGPVQRDDEPAEPLFYAVARWSWRTAAD